MNKGQPAISSKLHEKLRNRCVYIHIEPLAMEPMIGLDCTFLWTETVSPSWMMLFHRCSVFFSTPNDWKG